jgi:hypothetical protein
MNSVLAQLGYPSDFVIEPSHVWTHGLGEQKRYAIQHTLHHQIWELDQPHYGNGLWRCSCHVCALRVAVLSYVDCDIWSRCDFPGIHSHQS